MLVVLMVWFILKDQESWSGGLCFCFCPMSLSLAPQTGDVPEV
jgi:hypothetical protein